MVRIETSLWQNFVALVDNVALWSDGEGPTPAALLCRIRVTFAAVDTRPR